MSNKKWNRSSAWTPEQLAVINSATSAAVTRAVEIFDSSLQEARMTLTEDQERSAYATLANNVTEGIAEFVESLKQ